MPKIKRGGYIFVTWVGDHSPYHVHVFRDGVEVVKYDLINHRVMSGKINACIYEIIQSLLKEGLL